MAFNRLNQLEINNLRFLNAIGDLENICADGSRPVRILTQARKIGYTWADIGTVITPMSRTSFNEDEELVSFH